jgi:3-deoxy-manno-octulosonate cytidylyltransferase (CMP-KDO synthetase)
MGLAQEGLAVIIPARLESSRFPRKLLQTIESHTVLEWTWRRARAAVGPECVWIATDGDEIAAAASAFGARVIRTGAHRCGSERVAAAAATLGTPVRRVVNLQADEPLVDPRAIRAAAERLCESDEAIVTCGAPLAGAPAWNDPAVVKVVATRAGRVLFFSRAPIPWGAGEGAFERVREVVSQHVGLYGYPREMLERFVQLPPSPLELVESLEQMRALEAGMRIELVRLAGAAPAVDTPADLERVRAIVRARGAAAWNDGITKEGA